MNTNLIKYINIRVLTYTLKRYNSIHIIYTYYIHLYILYALIHTYSQVFNQYIRKDRGGGLLARFMYKKSLLPYICILLICLHKYIMHIQTIVYSFIPQPYLLHYIFKLTYTTFIYTFLHTYIHIHSDALYYIRHYTICNTIYICSLYYNHIYVNLNCYKRVT